MITEHSRRNRATPATRSAIEPLRALAEPWWGGRIGELAFLQRLYDLDELHRQTRASRQRGRDIVRRREVNLGWNDDWLFSDLRLRLGNGLDEVLLGFLAQIVHPGVPRKGSATQVSGGWIRCGCRTTACPPGS
jgi:hypothetical protein